MAVTLPYFTEFGKHTFQHITAESSCCGIYAGVYCILYHVYDVVVKKVHVRYLISWWVSCIVLYCIIDFWKLPWMRSFLFRSMSALLSFPFYLTLPFVLPSFTPTLLWYGLNLPQRVQAEPGSETTFGVYFQWRRWLEDPPPWLKPWLKLWLRPA